MIMMILKMMGLFAFPLIKLAKKLKVSSEMQLRKVLLVPKFPLIKLAKKLKADYYQPEGFGA